MPADTFPLGDHGEGYCRACCFIQPLDADGRLAPHGHDCKGSGKKPTPAPYRSTKAAFKSEGPTGYCSVCGDPVGLHADGRAVAHATTGPGGWDVYCQGGYRRPIG